MSEPSVHVEDVAEYILHRLGPMSTMKLQKLVYYCQAWSLVWDGVPLFPEPIQAWANGPVSPDLFRRHKGQYRVESVQGNADRLSPTAQDTVIAVVDYYGQWDGQQLSDLSHAEPPWVQTRGELEPGAPTDAPIPWAMMREYFASIPTGGEE